ncbi:MFS transporter [Pararobbsia silviterrae]|uniref:MFS transporter n=1 Tax=Pararobbsia silviterrae TaxID=1792498 RepID=A0A494Y536_9BURK|nr:MFS transporter [Pararobbsia silviterrae]RKP57816.1 MFS transporter [Pararobbsia silviterrae]
MTTAPARGADATMENAAYAKITLRLIPLLFICYVAAYLDRVNVGFAKLQMLSDLQFSETVYGLGAGIFFIGYAVCEVPSNIMLHKVGARVWLSRIMLTWGVLAGAMIFVKTPTTFYILRLLLGIAEAGFLPGVVHYLTYWYPSAKRGRVAAIFFTAIPASGLIGGPLSGWIMQSLSGAHGFAGWQWMFLVEAVPSIVLAFVLFFKLPNRIADASWLDAEEKHLLQKAIDEDEAQKQHVPIARIFTDKRVLILIAVCYCLALGNYGISFWLPSIIKATGVKSILETGLLSAIPSAAAIVGMVLLGRSADRTRQRKWHLGAAMAIGGLGMWLSVVFSSNTALALTALSIASIGAFAGNALFWSLPTAFLAGAGAAAAVAFINCTTSTAGFLSPYLIGWVKDATGSTDAAMLILAGFYALGLLILAVFVPARLVNR